jgi:hypothetical protein
VRKVGIENVICKSQNMRKRLFSTQKKITFSSSPFNSSFKNQLQWDVTMSQNIEKKSGVRKDSLGEDPILWNFL